jgi:hypothetical protein
MNADGEVLKAQKTERKTEGEKTISSFVVRVIFFPAEETESGEHRAECR